MQTRDAPEPEVLKPELHVHVDAPEALVELAGQPEHEDAPAALYVPALHAAARCTYVRTHANTRTQRQGGHACACEGVCMVGKCVPVHVPPLVDAVPAAQAA